MRVLSRIAVLAVLAASACSPGAGTAPLLGYRWEQVAGAPFDGFVSAVVAGGPGFVAVGSVEREDGESSDAAVWVSSDGNSWERVSEETLTSAGGLRSSMTEVAASSSGLVSLGGVRSRASAEGDWVSSPAVWWSANGYRWERVPPEVFGDSRVQITAVTSWGSGFALLGVERTGEHARRVVVWLSPDGVSWQRVPHDDALFGAPNELWWARTIVALDSGLYVGGTLRREAYLWHSPDGQTWQRTLIGGPPSADYRGVEDVRGIVETSAGLVVFGRTGVPPCEETTARWADPTAVLWVSADGVTWDSGPTDRGIRGDSYVELIDSIIAVGDGLLAFGEVGYCTGQGLSALEPTVWTSDEGNSWERHPGPVPMGFRSIAAGPSRLIGVGRTASGSTVWIGTPTDE